MTKKKIKNDYLTHVNLNTTHISISHKNDISSDIMSKLINIFNNITASGDSIVNIDEIFPDYCARGYVNKHGYVIELLTEHKNNIVPVLTTGGSITSKKIWKILHTDFDSTILLTNENKCPEFPYTADRIEKGIILCPEITKWTGDFCRCMGWAYIIKNR